MYKKEKKGKKIKKLNIKILTIVILVVVLLLLIEGIKLQPQINDNYDEIKELEAQKTNEEQRAKEADALKGKVDTDEYIEKIARDKLGMVKKDEILFVDISGEE